MRIERGFGLFHRGTSNHRAPRNNLFGFARRRGHIRPYGPVYVNNEIPHLFIIDALHELELATAVFAPRNVRRSPFLALRSHGSCDVSRVARGTLNKYEGGESEAQRISEKFHQNL